MCGSYAALAREIGTSPAALNHMKSGKREVSPETAALLADAAHENAAQAVIDAIIERNKTGPKAEKLREILGKGKAAGVAATWLLCSIAPITYAIGKIANELTVLHIVLSRVRHIFRLEKTVGGVPHGALSVNGKGFAAVLTRSLRSATSCGLRAAH